MNAREEAIEVMARALHADEWDGKVSWDSEPSPDYWRRQSAVALDALLFPQSTECEACGGTGHDWQREGGFVHCPSCNGSGRIEKGPIAYLSAELEQVGRMTFFEEGSATRDLGCVGMVWDRPSKSPFPEPEVFVYRLPSESTNGVKDE